MDGTGLGDVYRHVFNRSPSEIVNEGLTLRERDLRMLLDFHESASCRATSAPDGGIWPLVSHHAFGNRTLVGGDRADVLGRALTLLLIHDGIVIADPIAALKRTRQRRGTAVALSMFGAITRDLARIEPLIEAGVIRTARSHPDLEDAARAAVLKVFGVGPDLRVFVDFVQAAGSVRAQPDPLLPGYARQVRELYRLFGMRIGAPRSEDEAEGRVVRLGAALIEVSWQLAVASADPSCDLAFRGSLERRLFEEAINAGLEGDIGPARHFGTLDLGKVPNLDPAALTVADALSIRGEDAFERFRYDVRQGLDRLEASTGSGAPAGLAVASFEDSMRESSRRLGERIRRGRLIEVVKNDAVHAALGTMAAAPGGPGAAAAAAAASIGSVVAGWLRGRLPGRRSTTSLRYLSMLGRRKAPRGTHH